MKEHPEQERDTQGRHSNIKHVLGRLTDSLGVVLSHGVQEESQIRHVPGHRSRHCMQL